MSAFRSLSAWVLRVYGVGGGYIRSADGSDRPGTVEPRKFYGPECNRKAAHDIARGTGPRCENCQRLGTEARPLFTGPDPYQSEINGDDTVVLLCGACLDASWDEI